MTLSLGTHCASRSQCSMCTCLHATSQTSTPLPPVKQSADTSGCHRPSCMCGCFLTNIPPRRASHPFGLLPAINCTSLHLTFACATPVSHRPSPVKKGLLLCDNVAGSWTEKSPEKPCRGNTIICSSNTLTLREFERENWHTKYLLK